MTENGTFDLDEHAAFWARDDERKGVADERFEFNVGDENFVARGRSALSVRDGAHGRDSKSYFYEIGESRALLIADSALFPILRGTTIENYLTGRYYCFRPFHPREAARYGAKIYPDGTGEWFYRTQDKKGNLGFLSQSPFRFGDEQTALEFLKLPQAEFLDLCAQQWDSPASELRASYEFDRLSLAERDAQVLSCENGDGDELRRLVDLLAHLIWTERVEAQLQFEGEFENVIGLDLQTGDLLYCREDQIRARLNRLQRAWRKAILRVVAPVYIGQAVLPMHIEHWLKQGRVSLRVLVQSPTHHELLEAQLQLRDWARENLSPAEQNELELLRL